MRRWERSVKDVLFGLLVCALILLAEKTIIQLLSINYHRKTFDAKIKDIKRRVDLLGYLYDASRTMFPMHCKEFRADDAAIADPFLGANKVKAPGGASFTRPLKFVKNNVGKVGGKVTSAFGSVAHELTGKQMFNSNSARSVVAQALERKPSTEALARRIWMSFVIEGRESLFLDDLVEVLGAGREMDAEEAFAMLDRDENGDVNMDEMALTLTEFAKRRKALNRSMHDVDEAIDALDGLLMAVAFVIGVLVFGKSSFIFPLSRPS